MCEHVNRERRHRACGDVSPRSYRMGQRQAAVDDTRQRVLNAARALLADPSGYKAFTVDAVARAADVARPTVYYQFGSKTGLIEALCDDLAADGRLEDLAGAFGEADPLAALAHLAVAFAQFWASQRLLTRRLRALAALDPEVGQVIAARDQRRRQALRVLVSRLASEPDYSLAQDADSAVSLLMAITSFETFDVVAPPEATGAEAGELIAGLVPGILRDLS
jgi:AcrR family transcriptional regulator